MYGMRASLICAVTTRPRRPPTLTVETPCSPPRLREARLVQHALAAQHRRLEQDATVEGE